MTKIIYFLMTSIAIAGPPAVEKNDREILERFLEKQITKGPLGYVLLGDKPAVFFDYIPNLSWTHPLCSLGALRPYSSKGNQLQKAGWQIWKKYFPMSFDHFLFVEEISPYSPLSVWVFVIHRDLFCKTINENRDQFERLLGRKVTGEQLFEEAKRLPFFSVLLNKNEELLGILLGFGRNNAQLFSQRKMKELGRFPKEEDKISSIALPVFRANWEDPETIQLRKKYLNCRQKIKTTFLDNNTYDQVIKILFEGSPSAIVKIEFD